jgi:ATP-dependent DNA helicase DinG
MVVECFHAAESFFADLAFWLQCRPGCNGRVREGKIVENRISPSIHRLTGVLRKIMEKIKDAGERSEWRSACDRITTLSGSVDVWLLQSLEEESVYWLESFHTSRGKQRVTINAAPINIGPILREQLFGKMSSVVLTSATLTTG